jgi:hypothetical protein
MSQDFLNVSGFERAVARIGRRFDTITSVNPADVVAGLLDDENFKKQVIDSVSENDKLVQKIINDPRLRERIAKDILDNHPTLIQDITNLLVDSTELHHLIVEMALSTPTFIDAVANVIMNNETLINEIKQEILDGNSTLIQNLANQIIETIASLSMVDSEGKKIATRDGGTFEFQAASDEQFGIVKGQQNDSAATWHLVSFVGGLGSINRAELVTFIETEIRNNSGTGGGITYQDVMDILNRIRLLAPDGSPVGINNDGMITLQQATPAQYGVCKPHKNSPCSPQKTAWRTMDGSLVAQTKHDIHMFVPFSFPKEMPHRIKLFDRLTFIPINAGQQRACCRCVTKQEQ